MVNRRQQLYDDVVNKILPQLYKSHLSFVKTQAESKKIKNAKTPPFYVVVKGAKVAISYLRFCTKLPLTGL